MKRALLSCFRRTNLNSFIAGFLTLFFLGCLFTLCPSGVRAAKKVDITGKWLRLTSSLDGKTARGSLVASTSGRAGTDKKFVISFYLQRPNGQWKHLYDRKVKKLGVNQSVEVPFSWTAGNSLTGRKVLAILDSDNRIVEKSEANNRLKRVIAAGRSPVSIAGPDQTARVGDIVFLDGGKSNDPYGYGLTYAWSFVSKPDGSASVLSEATSVMPTFTADIKGVYVIKLTVNDGLFSNEDSVTISTINSAPVANAGPDQRVTPGATCELDGSGSSDVDGDQLTYTWSFVGIPAGSASVLSSTDAVRPTFVADVAGTYKVQLVVNDGTNDSDPDTVIVTTGNAKPVANAGPAQSVSVSQTVTLDGSGSSDADKSTLSYRWSFVSRPVGSSASLSSMEIVNPTFMVDEPGTYVVQLIVNDGTQDSPADTVIITTGNVRPVARATATAGSVTVDDVVSLDGSASSDADSDPFGYSWSLITLPSGSSASLSDTAAEKPSFTADTAGDYVAQLVVDDGTLKSDPSTVLVTAQAKLTTVPDVGGKTQSEAQTALTAVNLVMGTVSQQASDTVKSGLVISQTPVSGTQVEEGSSVALVISKGPATVNVPDVTGKTQSEAETALKNVGLVLGTVTTGYSNTVSKDLVISQDPAASTTVSSGSAVAVAISLGPSAQVPGVTGLLQNAAQSAVTGASLKVGTITYQNSGTVDYAYVISQSPSSGATVAADSSVDLVVSLGPQMALPPDPVTVAPILSTITTTGFSDTIGFLYSGSDPVQTGVTTGAIVSGRASVIRGKVFSRYGVPLPGVTITVLNHTEYGQTLSRSDGTFDLVVNGGGALTINYARSGYLPAQRKISSSWNDSVWLPDVILTQLDSKATTIDLTETIPVQVVQGSVQTDNDGTRQAKILIPEGTTAAMYMADGSSQPISSLTVRATEYTAGSDGRKGMPAELPASSAYTYAVELSVDEAITAGATKVQFSSPVYYYVENFLGFPVGMKVPSGYYDRVKAAWVSSTNGRVIGIINTSGGTAAVDVDGDGNADDTATLGALGFSSAELEKLASLYSPGQTLWRIPISHFTPWDFNWPAGPPSSATTVCNGADCDPVSGSITNPTPTLLNGYGLLDVQNQAFRESIEIKGTPYSLEYSSNRVSGRADWNRVNLVISGSTVPADLKRIDVEISVAGQIHTLSFPAQANQSYTFVWDGTDAYGRVLNEAREVLSRIGYVYNAVYQEPADMENTFGLLSGIPITGSKAREEVTLWQSSRDTLIPPPAWYVRGQGLGGWTLSQHHAYDPVDKILYMGDGRTRKFGDRTYDSIITTIAGTGVQSSTGDNGPATEATLDEPSGMDFGPDGTLYFAQSSRVRKISPEGVITTIVADDGTPLDVAVGPDGVYVCNWDRNRIDRYYQNTSGTYSVETVAGSTGRGFSGDGGKATEAELNLPYGIAVAPDGTIYIADTYNERIRRVGPDGIITTFAGSGIRGSGGDGGPATDAEFSWPTGVAIGPDGSVYIVDGWNDRIRKVTPDGIINTVAGGGSEVGDGGPATDAYIGSPRKVKVMSDGTLYIAESDGHRIRKVSPEGIISTVAGNGQNGFGGDGAPPRDAIIGCVWGVAVSPNGLVYLSSFNNRIRRIETAAPSDASDILIASENGTWVYRFNSSGRHLSTVNSLTGVALLTFGYDSDGRLTSVTDSDGNVTQISRTGGVPTAVVSPYGAQTAIEVNADGWLSKVTSPGGSVWNLGYSGVSGLLTQVTSPRNSVYGVEYDSLGLLTRAVDANNAGTVLSSTAGSNWNEITVTSAEGVATRFRSEYLLTGEQVYTTYSADGLSEKRREYSGGMEVTSSDGTVTTIELAADPRFGMRAAYVKSATTTRPGGPTSTAGATRTVTLTDPDDLLSLEQLVETSTVNDKTTTSTYVAGTKTYTITTPAGRTSTIRLDSAGRTLGKRFGDLDETVYSYDGHGRLSQVALGTRTTTLEYDTGGFLPSKVTDPISGVGHFERDSDGRITTQRLQDDRTIGYVYDAGGLPTRIQPPAGSEYTFTWTGIGLPDVTTLSDGQTCDMDYGPDRELTARRSPGGSVSLTYDAAGRLTDQTLDSGAVITTGYGSDGRMATQSVPGQSLAFTWAGDLLASQTSDGLVKGTVAVTFDGFSRLISQSVGGSAVTFGYDDDGLRTSAGLLAISRNSVNGLITGTALGDMADSYGYNGFAELESYSAAYSSTQLYSASYLRDALGRITHKEEQVGGETKVYDYAYDATGRLTGYSIDGVEAASYAYDARDNRTGIGGAETTYSAGDHLVSLGSTQYAYDGGGRLASVTTAGQATVYTHDTLGRLLSVDPPGDNNTVSYDYDGMGRRIRRSVNGTVTHRWIYHNGPRPVAEVDETGEVITRFVYGSRLATPDYMTRGGSTYRIITDERGSVRLVVKVDDGTIVQRIDYGPWGQVTSDDNPGFQPFGFAGGLHDPDTGLVRFGARDYDPAIGRFTSPDPVFLDGGQTNLYAYVGNDPINSSDLLGLSDGKLGFSAFGMVMGGVSLPQNIIPGTNFPGTNFAPRTFYTSSSGEVLEVFNSSAKSTLNFARGVTDYGNSTYGGFDVTEGVQAVEEVVEKPAVNTAKNTAQVVKNSASTLSKVGQMAKIAAKVAGNRMTTFILIPTAILDPSAVRPKIEM